MVYPVDPKTATFNTNKHDAFGVDTGGRKLPHTGIDFAGSGPVNSVYGGQVIWSGFDKEAGWSIVIRENDGKRRGYGHMASKPNYVVGQWVGKGDRIGTIGATGTGALGAHLHMWEANTDAAAIRVLTGYIDYKGGRTTKQWAEGMGLNDPMPAIQASLRETENKPQKPETPKPVPTLETDDEMILLFSNTRPHGVLIFPSGRADPLIDPDTRANLKKDGGIREAKVADAWLDSLVARGSK